MDEQVQIESPTMWMEKQGLINNFGKLWIYRIGGRIVATRAELWFPYTRGFYE